MRGLNLPIQTARLQSKDQIVPCPMCAFDRSEIKIEGKDFLHRVEGKYFVSVCLRCGFWYQNPRLPSSELSSFYPPDYLPHADPAALAKDDTIPFHPGMLDFLSEACGYSHLKKSGNIFWPVFNFLWKHRIGVNLLPIFVRQGKVLDIGCGNGRQLMLLKKLAWNDLHGIEFVPSAANFAKQLGFSVKIGRVEEKLADYPDGYFDVIMASMVLEHLENPREVINLISRKLKSGGEFLFSTITRDALDRRLFGRYWAGFDFPRHLVYLSNKNIYNLIQDDFMNIHFYHQNAPIDFIRSSKWRLDSGDHCWFDKLIQWAGEKRLRLIVSLLAFMNQTCRVSVRSRKKT